MLLAPAQCPFTRTIKDVEQTHVRTVSASIAAQGRPDGSDVHKHYGTQAAFHKNLLTSNSLEATPMMLVRTYLSNSSIEGVGIFASEPIKAGDLIWRLEPKFDVSFTEADVEKLPPHMQDFVARYSYPHMRIPGILVLELDNGRFMNHSETPNTDFTDFEFGYAICDIAQGEEITCNYREFDSSFVGWFPQVTAGQHVDLRAGHS